MIDENDQARLAYFGLLTFVSSSPYPKILDQPPGFGTTRWQSPELIDSVTLRVIQPTEKSDCYALGMVLLEVFSGEPPFAGDEELIVRRKIAQGERPERPEGAWFTNDLWRTVEQCWLPQPKDRPTAEAVLRSLDQASEVWHTPPPISGAPIWDYDQRQQLLQDRGTSRTERQEISGPRKRIIKVGGVHNQPNTQPSHNSFHSSQNVQKPDRKLKSPATPEPRPKTSRDTGWHDSTRNTG